MLVALQTSHCRRRLYASHNREVQVGLVNISVGIVRPHRSTTYAMRFIVTDQVAWSVCKSDTVVGPAKTAEPIEMATWRLGRGLGWAQGTIIRWGSDPPCKGAILRGKIGGRCEV